MAGALRDNRQQPGAGLLPSSWGMFQATRWDWATYFGTIGLFLFLFFLFIRLLPMISIFEVRTLLPQAKVEEEVRRMNQTDLRRDGRIRQPDRAGERRAPPARRATASWTPIRRSRSKS